jgi:hypothetical protein
MQRGDGSREARKAGTPQGGPLSPLLANIYLDPMDKELEKRGVSFVRYADDIAIFASSARSAERILESVVKWLKKELGLEVNREKSGTGRSGESSLLGFRLQEDGQIGISPKAVEKLKEKVKEYWDARQSKTSGELREQWQSYIRGWWNYFRLADRRREVNDLSGCSKSREKTSWSDASARKVGAPGSASSHGWSSNSSLAAPAGGLPEAGMLAE